MFAAAIRTSKLTRRFGRTTAVDALDLEVPAGSVYGFLGPNGAGKTTTIRLLLGLIHPSAGAVELCGEPLTAASRRRLLARVGSLVETPSLYAHLTGRENLELSRRLLDAPRSRIDDALRTVRLVAAAGRRVRDYSLGMRQRLGIALALLGEPDLVVLDEPTNGLDPAGIHEIRDLVRRLPGERGTTVFLSSHLLSEVEQVATDIGIVRAGRLLFQGPIEALQVERQPRVRIVAEPAAEALRLLRRAGWSARRREDEPGAIVVDAMSSADAARMNNLLVLHGIRVSHLAVGQSSLEEIFLRMTGAADARVAALDAGRVAAGDPR